MKKIFYINFWIVFFSDIILLTLAYYLSYLFRFEFLIPPNELHNFYYTLFPILIIKMSIFYLFGLYRGMYRYTTIIDLINLIKASFVSSSIIIIGILIIHRFEGFARSVYFIDGILTVSFIGGFRLSTRLFFYNKKLHTQQNNSIPLKRLLIIGAGDAGEKILREIKENRNLYYNVIGFLDDNKRKHNKLIHRVKILGDINKAPTIVNEKNIDEILIALPSVKDTRMREIINICQRTKARCRTIPGIGELINGKITASIIRDISYEDLLGRDPIKINLKQIGSYLNNKIILITGAGGSIGSELSRQVALFKPKLLILFDKAESSLYDIKMELQQLNPEQEIAPILGSVTSKNRIEKLFSEYKPHVIFHTAAYKHVPMIEYHPWEAIYNNLLGTKYVLDAAIKNNAEKFVLVSTDKAVRPTNIMGATKRITELYLTHKAGLQSKTDALAVRFGNVVGSSGSVVPLFKKQIANGGPVTVTHPEVLRYFMTISEACQLIVQAGSMGSEGEIYILKMGKPIKIVDVACDLIRLSGFKPYEDIEIKFTGLRAGEKMYEELITKGEGIVPTKHEKLMVLKPNKDINNNTQKISLKKINDAILELVALADNYDKEGIKKKIKQIIPEYLPYAEV